MKICYEFCPFLNNYKDLDPSYETDLDFWDCFGKKKNPSYNRRNAILSHNQDTLFKPVAL